MLNTSFWLMCRIALNVQDCYVQGRRLWLRLHEKNGRVLEMPCNHDLEAFLDAHISAAGIATQKGSPLFRTTYQRTKELTESSRRRE